MLGVALAEGHDGDALEVDGRTWPVVARLPKLYPEWLGDRAFCETHGVRFPYVVGEMARGIAGSGLVAAAATAGFLGFLGAGGLPPKEVEATLDRLGRDVPASAYGVNLIHSPQEPGLEDALVDLLLARGVPLVSLSAYLGLTPSVVRLACSGLRVDAGGQVVRPRRLMAKVSRPEVAASFLSPAPARLLDELVRAGRLGHDEATLAARFPIVEDVTAEGDSGGHTDQRPLCVLLPLVCQVRDELARRYDCASRVRVGAAGGIGTPAAAAAAFALGAAYVVTGSVNQAAVEAGMSQIGKEMLAAAGFADVAMAPSADMFEIGARVQVLRKGTLFPARAARLHEIYRGSGSLDDLPGETRAWLERDVLRQPIAQVWREIEEHFARRSPSELERAAVDARHRMALVFRWYLGRSSRWPIDGDAGRKLDFQIWTGPAMGAFNEWVRGSFLEPLGGRSVAQIGLNLLEGAAVITRAQALRCAGVPVPQQAFRFAPRPLR